MPAERRLECIVWLTTSRCTLACSHCYAWLYRGEGDLPTRESLRLIEEASSLGVEEIHFTGGEPLLRPDLFELLAESQRLGVEPSLFTNLTLLNEGSLKRIVDLRVPVFTSMDGHCREAHESLRGPGSWAKLVEGIEALVREGVRVHVNVTVTETNWRYVGRIIGLAAELGASSVSIIPAMRAGRALALRTYVSPDHFSKALVYAAEAGEEVGMVVSVWCAPFAKLVVDSRWIEASSCKDAGIMDVTPSGRVVACDVTNYTVAHVVDHGVAGSWRRLNEDPLVRRALGRVAREPCASCKLGARCRGGCYARAWLSFNDPGLPDPLCPAVESAELGLGEALAPRGPASGLTAGLRQ
ncbi:MAG: radical SAM protein [Candidatus Nezhaarchaeales archaeon]